MWYIVRNLTVIHRPIPSFPLCYYTETTEAGNGHVDEAIANLVLFLIAVAAGDKGLPPLLFDFSLTFRTMEKTTVAK